MSEEMNMYKAQQVYYSIVRMLNEKNWKFDRFDDDLVIRSGVKGEDLPIEFLIVVKPKQQLVQIISKLPFSVPEDKRVEVAIAVAIANNGLVNGSFDYDISNGNICFRLTSSFLNSELSDDLFDYMITCAAGTIDAYNDDFFAVCKNLMTLEEFMDTESTN